MYVQWAIKQPFLFVYVCCVNYEQTQHIWPHTALLKILIIEVLILKEAILTLRKSFIRLLKKFDTQHSDYKLLF